MLIWINGSLYTDSLVSLDSSAWVHFCVHVLPGNMVPGHMLAVSLLLRSILLNQAGRYMNTPPHGNEFLGYNKISWEIINGRDVI